MRRDRHPSRKPQATFVELPPTWTVAVGRGIDGIARICKDALASDPFSGTAYIFRNRRSTAIKILVYDGQEFRLGRDFYRHLCHALGVPYGSTAGDVFLSVTRHVEDLVRERVFRVFLVDEAHLLHQDCAKFQPCPLHGILLAQALPGAPQVESSDGRSGCGRC